MNLDNPQLFEATTVVAHLHGLGITHGDLKGVRCHVLKSLFLDLRRFL